MAFISGGKLPFAYGDLGFIALAFAFAFLAMIYTIEYISGCHLNPAVTLAMAFSKRMSWKDAVACWSTELVGAVLGVGFIGLCYGFTKATQLGYNVTNFNEASTGYLVSIAAEIVGTAFLLFVIMGLAVDVPLNPFRSLAPAVLQVVFGATYQIPHLATNFIRKAIGAILGVVLYDFITREAEPQSGDIHLTTLELMLPGSGKIL